MSAGAVGRYAAPIAFLLAVAAGAWLRLHDLALRPLHHDEGVNALFLFDLIERNHYRYDPSNYHGPLLYYMVAPLLKLVGETTVLLRLWPAVIGTATLLVFWPLRPVIGVWGAVVATWLLALSPVAVYFSRDLIHESWFAGAGAMILAGGVGYAATRRAGNLVLAWAGVALLFATKETAPFVLASLAAGALSACLAAGFDPRPGLVRHLRDARQHHAWGIVVASIILVVLFTSFFSNLQGFLDLFRAYNFWAKTGTAGAGHEKPWAYFFEMLWRYERAMYVLAVGGLLVAAVRRDVAVGFGVAALAMLVVHAVIPYKTPWLILCLLPWLAASAGYLADRAVVAVDHGWLRALPAIGLTVLLPALGRDSHRVSFVDYDDDRETFVYSQTRRGFLDLVRALEVAAAASPKGLGLPVSVMSPDHFPLNWYGRDFTEVRYLSDHSWLEWDGVIIATREQLPAIRRTMEVAHYARSFPLRPGVDLELLMPAELFDAAAARLDDAQAWVRVGPVSMLEPVAAAALPPRLAPGLLARPYPGAELDGWPGPDQPGRPVAIDYDHGENREWTPPHAIEWVGYLHAPAKGGDRFALESDDGSSLDLDGQQVIDNLGQHALQRREGQVRLEAGLHAVRVIYTDYGGGAKLVWRWQPPGSSVEVAVPITVLSHAP